MRSVLPLAVLVSFWFFQTPSLEAQSSAPGTTLLRPAVGFGSALAMSGDELLIGRPGVVAGFPMPPSHTGAVYVYRRGSGGQWSKVSTITGDGVSIEDGFGVALSADGNLMAVGAPGTAEQRGAVYVFERDGSGRWAERAKLTAGSSAPGDMLGRAVAIKGDVLLAGSPGHAENQGRVVVFRRSGSTWTEQGTLVGSQANKGERFGAALALDRDRALVGAPGTIFGDSAAAGRAIMFRRSGQTWTRESALTVEGGQVRGLGAALLLNGNEAFVSGPGSDSMAGAVFLFRSSAPSKWDKPLRLAAESPEHPAFFGGSLARDGQDLLIGAPFAQQGVGAVHVFRRDGSSWKESQKLETTGVGPSTQFGATVAISRGLAAIGAPQADYFEGSVRVYRKDGNDWRSAGSVVDSTVTGLAAVTGGEARCEGGKAKAFDCRDADLVSFLPVSAVGGKRGVLLNDLWGWTDSVTNREFALVGRTDGTAFVEVTDPANPKYLGYLPLHQGARSNIWRGIKVYKNHAFVVADGAGPHGMQVFDLTQLRNVQNPPVRFEETAHYDRIHSAHTIAINEKSGFAYPVGNSMGGETCGGALHMIDIRDPARPKFAGCYADPSTGRARTGYTHESQCVIYHGPDEQYNGREICFNASETAVGIADVTDKKNPKPISVASYPNVSYTHQGWLTEDHRYFYLNDELDELDGHAAKTRTIVFDVSDLDDPVVAKEFFGTTAATDHNLYVRGNYMYQSNYVAGLRVIDIKDPVNPVEVGFFDTVPFGENAPGFAGSWTNFPFFKSGVVAVTSMREGLFMIRYRPQTLVP
ncbi:MAG TPA: choice-of-anchor B family protein [Gemmatimonadales bacterium]|nr:choice-of-anchor B family protein [Gemmatimonadales bacterium]